MNNSLSIPERSRLKLLEAIRAAGLVGVESAELPPNFRLIFPPDMSALDRTKAKGIADGWDWSDAGQALRDRTAVKAAAKAMLDETSEIGLLLRAILYGKATAPQQAILKQNVLDYIDANG